MVTKTVKNKIFFIYHAYFFVFFYTKIFLTHKPQKSLQCFQLASNKQHKNLNGLQNTTAIFNNFDDPLKNNNLNTFCLILRFCPWGLSL